MKRYGLSIILCLLLVPCMASGNRMQGTADLVTMTPRPFEGPLVNPEMGWGLWAGPRFFDATVRSEAQNTTGFGDDAPLFSWVLVDWTWADLEPQSGKYDWSGLDRIIRYWTARFLGIRREEEIEAATAAAAAGVAPDVLYAEPTGVMVMPFIEGKHWEPEAFHEPGNILRLADTLRRLHALTTVAANGSEYRRIERLLESAASLGLELPPGIDDYRAKLARIERERTSDPRYVPGLAHNDFWANNFLDDGKTLYLVDWEFSGTGKPSSTWRRFRWPDGIPMRNSAPC